MAFILTTANDIELKYGPQDLDLVWDYIGPNRSHGDGYYDNKKCRWYECISPINDLIYSNGRPNAIICVSENIHLPMSLHISVFEVFRDARSKGIGTQIIADLLLEYKELGFKTCTLQAQNDRAKNFYKKIGFVERKINKCPILRKFI
jgi:ribosomal protein S18 acetylase RimI-like enzyme